MNNQTPWYISSTGDGLSASIGGFSIMGIAQAIGMVLAFLGHPIPQDSIYAGLVTIATAIGAIYAAFGVLRKVYLWIYSILSKKTA